VALCRSAAPELSDATNEPQPKRAGQFSERSAHVGGLIAYQNLGIPVKFLGTPSIISRYGLDTVRQLECPIEYGN
jgi:hypothetical protein